MDKNLQFEPLYPDVLGAIAGGLRITFDEALQVAIGLFPRSAYLNQPIEVIVIMQSMVDQPMDIKVALHLPKKSPDGTVLNLSTPKNMVSLTLSPGEVGVLRMPVVALQPSQPADNVAIQAAIRYRARAGKTVRPPTRGAPASALSVSPFKLQVLRDVQWVDHPRTASPENIVVPFDLNPKRLPPVQQTLKPTYEALWTQERMREEKRNILSHIDEARTLASSFTRVNIYEPLLHAVDESYAARGLPLHPGEAHAIAKMLTYAVDDYSRLDPKYKLEDQRWFQGLCQLLAHDDDAVHWTPGEILTRYLLESVMYEAILVAFTVIRSRVKVDFGDRAERVAYADKVMRWLAGQIEPDLIYIYLPLALGGVIINHQVTWTGDDPWQVVDGLREAYRGRVRLIQGDAMEIFDILDKLLTRAEDDLRRSRIQR